MLMTRLLPWLCTLAFSTHLVASQKTSSRTIDDEFGDLVTGVKPTYVPASGSWHNTDCPGCAIHPDKNSVFRGTWHAATYRGEPEVSVQFNFTGVYSLRVLTLALRIITQTDATRFQESR